MIEEGMFDKSNNAKNTVMNYVIFDNDNQQDDLSFCLDYIGVQKYKEILDFCNKKFLTETINYCILRSIAIYDSKLSDELYIILRLFENRIKALISNKWGNVIINKNNYLDIINEQISNDTKKVTQDLYFPNKFKGRSINIYELLKESSIKGALAIAITMEKEQMCSIPINLLYNAQKVVNLRNIVYHHKIIVNKLEKFKIIIIDILRTLPLSIRNKYIKKINDCVIDNDTKEFSPAKPIALIINKNTEKSILDFGVLK